MPTLLPVGDHISLPKRARQNKIPALHPVNFAVMLAMRRQDMQFIAVSVIFTDKDVMIGTRFDLGR